MRRTLGVTVLLLSLVGCTGGSGPETPEAPGATDSAAAAAAALATALATGDLGGLGGLGSSAFLDLAPERAQAAYDAAVGELGELTPAVDVGGVSADPADADRATATLAWSWPVGPEAWSYQTEVPLTRDGATWSARWSPAVLAPGLVDGESLALGSLSPERGDVLGAGGAVLVTERPVRAVGIDKTQVTDPAALPASARALARLVDVDVAAYVAAVRGAGPEAFVVAITYRAEQVPVPVEAGLAGILGGRAVAGEQALAPTREFAAPLLGRVGPVTAEMVQAQPEVYRAGDVAGLSGLQARYDAALRGTPGVVVQAVPGQGASGEPRELFRSAAVPGTPLSLTLDERVQRRAERALVDVGPASAIVALRPSTGELLAVANGPGNGGQNFAALGQYAPGSTFKIVSSLALLRSGLGPDDDVACTPTRTVDGRVFGNYSDYPATGIGDIALRTALANSCNTAFISQADRLDPAGADLAAAAQALGLGTDRELGFPAYVGQVEAPASLTQAAADLIGQGRVLASPMTMAAVIGSVQQGATVVPRLVVDPAPPADTAPAPAVPLTTAEADTLRGMLRGVVTDGSAAALADVPGAPVIAKTGTAEFGTGPDLATHAWMVAAQGDLAVAVFVEVGRGGSTTAGPILEAFLRSLRARR